MSKGREGKEAPQEPRPAPGKAVMLLGMPMAAHEASWRLGGAPAFFVKCINMGIDLSQFKTLDSVYMESVRIEKALGVSLL